jgi:hypothetical protein
MKKRNLWLLFVLAAAGCGDSSHHGDHVIPDQDLRRAMLAVSTKRVYFGHQSVGTNIIGGLRSLYGQAGDVHLNIMTPGEGQLPPGAFFAESRIGKNTVPESKCTAFANTMERLRGDSVDIALMKFCYVDFSPGTDVQKMFGLYTDMIAKLKKEFPSVTFVHVTVPLTVRTPLWKKIAKRILGRAGNSDDENLKRAEFNALLVARFAGEPLFDLAGVESTYPDGARCSFESGGKTAYSLIPSLTNDGSHLNSAGAELAAAALIRTLAAAAERPPSPPR